MMGWISCSHYSSLYYKGVCDLISVPTPLLSLVLPSELLDRSVDSKEKSLQLVNGLLAKWAR